VLIPPKAAPFSSSPIITFKKGGCAYAIATRRKLGILEQRPVDALKTDIDYADIEDCLYCF
jgi:hypothetical protein